MVKQDAIMVTVDYSASLTDRPKRLCFEDRKDQKSIYSFFLFVTIYLYLFSFFVPHTHIGTDEVLMGLLNSALMSRTPSQDSLMKTY